MLLAPWTFAVLAAPAPVVLDWQAPAGCPDAAAVTAMTLDLLRQRPPETTRPPLHARAVVRRAAERFTVELELRAPEGDVRRTLGAHDCQLLARGVALLVAVHLDPMAVSQVFGGPALIAPRDPEPPALEPPTLAPPALAPPLAPPPEPAPAPASSPVDSLDLPEPPGPAQPPGPATGFGGHLRLEGGLDYGVLPRLGGDAILTGGVGSARWRVDLGVVGVALHTTPIGDATGRFNRLGGLVRGCAIWRVPPRRDTLALLGCLGVEAGAIFATTTDTAIPNAQRTPWAGPLLGGAARITVVGPVGLWIGVEAVIALVRRQYVVGASDPFTTGLAGFRANFGVDLQFVARKPRPPSTK